jgi:hypothetical protein
MTTVTQMTQMTLKRKTMMALLFSSSSFILQLQPRHRRGSLPRRQL